MKTILYIWDREIPGADFNFRSSSRSVIAEASARKVLETQGRYLIVVRTEDTPVPLNAIAVSNAEEMYGLIRGMVVNSSTDGRPLSVERYVSAEVDAAIKSILDERDSGVATFLHALTGAAND
jgi:hypothetical protein